MGEVRAAVRLVDALEFEPSPEAFGPLCSCCGVPTEPGKSELAPQTRVVCANCLFWFEREYFAKRQKNEEFEASTAARSIRWAGFHYHVDVFTGATEGEMMTIRFHGGQVMVTTRLVCQGIIPEEFRGVLGDNAIVQKGDPGGRGIGIFPNG